MLVEEEDEGLRPPDFFVPLGRGWGARCTRLLRDVRMREINRFYEDALGLKVIRPRTSGFTSREVAFIVFFSSVDARMTTQVAARRECFVAVEADISLLRAGRIRHVGESRRGRGRERGSGRTKRGTEGSDVDKTSRPCIYTILNCLKDESVIWYLRSCRKRRQT